MNFPWAWADAKDVYFYFTDKLVSEWWNGRGYAKGASLINSAAPVVLLLLCKIVSPYRWILLLCKMCCLACSGFEIEKSPPRCEKSRTEAATSWFLYVFYLREEAGIIRWVPRVLREVVVWGVGVWRWMGRRVDRLLGLHVPAGAGGGLLARHVRAGGWTWRWGTVLHVAGGWGAARGTAPWNKQKTTC